MTRSNPSRWALTSSTICFVHCRASAGFFHAKSGDLSMAASYRLSDGGIPFPVYPKPNPFETEQCADSAFHPEKNVMLFGNNNGKHSLWTEAWRFASLLNGFALLHWRAGTSLPAGGCISEAGWSESLFHLSAVASTNHNIGLLYFQAINLQNIYLQG